MSQGILLQKALSKRIGPSSLYTAASELFSNKSSGTTFLRRKGREAPRKREKPARLWLSHQKGKRGRKEKSPDFSSLLRENETTTTRRREEKTFFGKEETGTEREKKRAKEKLREEKICVDVISQKCVMFLKKIFKAQKIRGGHGHFIS